MQNDELTFGEKLSKAREDAGFNQITFAEKIPVDRKTLAKWERNFTFPNIEQIARMADLTNLPIEYFIDGYLNSMEGDNEQRQLKKLQNQTNRNTESIEKLRGNIKTYSDEMTSIAFAAVYVVLLVLSCFAVAVPYWPFWCSTGLIPSIACMILCVWRFRHKKNRCTGLMMIPAVVLLGINIYSSVQLFMVYLEYGR